MDEPETISLQISPETEHGEEDLAELTTQLRETLLELDVESVDLPVATAPPSTKGGPAVEWGTLVVTLGPQMINAVIRGIQGWLKSRRRGTVTVELGGDKITLHGVTAQDQQRLVEDWIKTHSRS